MGLDDNFKRVVIVELPKLTAALGILGTVMKQLERLSNLLEREPRRGIRTSQRVKDLCGHRPDPKTFRNPTPIAAGPDDYQLQVKVDCVKCGLAGTVTLDVVFGEVDWSEECTLSRLR